jgi:hypothetical protein
MERAEGSPVPIHLRGRSAHSDLQATLEPPQFGTTCYLNRSDNKGDICAMTLSIASKHSLGHQRSYCDCRIREIRSCARKVSLLDKA